MILKLLMILIASVSGCVKPENTDAENISCIKSITNQDVISGDIISNCSKLTVENSWVGYLCLCRINTLNKNYERARAACFKAKEINPFSADVYLEISRMYDKQGRSDEAITESEFAVSMNTENFEANMLLAKLIEKKDIEKSLKYYRRSLNILNDSSNPDIISQKKFVISKIDDIESKIRDSISEKKKNEYDKCMSDFKKIKNEKKALYTLEKCLSMRQTNNLDLNFTYLNLLYTNGRYQDVINLSSKIDEKKLTGEKLEKFYYIMADSYFQSGSGKNSLKYYDKLYKLGMNDHTMLLKYAGLLERDGDKLTAIEVYKKAYSMSNDEKIKEKINTLKLATMSDDDILNDMRERKFIDKSKVVLSQDDKKLFYSVKLAEKKGAIRFLEERYKGYANIILRDDDGSKRLMSQGFYIYLKYISQLAIKLFQENKILPNYLFKLKDENNNPIFDSRGMLTYEGMIAYYEATEKGSKTWYYPQEVPVKKSDTSDYKKKLEEIRKDMADNGYDEISESEYLYLIKATNCPEDILLNQPCNLKKVKINDDVKYFACSSLKCSSDAYNTPIRLFTYIVSYREGKPIDLSNASRNFFGSTTQKKRFCEDGKIWQGPELKNDELAKKQLEKDIEMIENYRKKTGNFIKNSNPRPSMN